MDFSGTLTPGVSLPGVRPPWSLSACPLIARTCGHTVKKTEKKRKEKKRKEKKEKRREEKRREEKRREEKRREEKRKESMKARKHERMKE